MYRGYTFKILEILETKIDIFPFHQQSICRTIYSLWQIAIETQNNSTVRGILTRNSYSKN